MKKFPHHFVFREVTYESLIVRIAILDLMLFLEYEEYEKKKTTALLLVLGILLLSFPTKELN